MESKKVAMNIRPTLIGAIIGDMLGSFYSSKDAAKIDFRNIDTNIAHTIDTLSILEIISICSSFTSEIYEQEEMIDAISMVYWIGEERGDQYYKFSGKFINWCKNAGYGDVEPYKFSGDPSILVRIIPISFYFKSADVLLKKVELVCGFTTSDLSEINSAKALALAIHLAYTGKDKDTISSQLKECFNGLPVSSFGLSYNPVELSIKAFLDSSDFESAIRNAISLSQDKFNLATLTGALAAAYYNDVPEDVAYLVRTKMSYEFQRKELEFFRKLRKCNLLIVKEEPKVCPLCGSRVVSIHYGLCLGAHDLDNIFSAYVDMSDPDHPEIKFKPKPILVKDQESARLSLQGGCVVSGGDPEWGCVGCEVKFISADKHEQYMRMLFGK